MKRVTLRLPDYPYRALKALKAKRPHMSMNALIVEACIRMIEK